VAYKSSSRIGVTKIHFEPLIHCLFAWLYITNLAEFSVYCIYRLLKLPVNLTITFRNI